MRFEFDADRLASARTLGLAIHGLVCAADRLLADTAGLLRRWGARAHQRRQLFEMDDQQLRDIGVSRVEAVRESRKLFWRR
jgi:uncharacterized protein YjiS (DUF1127 family)